MSWSLTRYVCACVCMCVHMCVCVCMYVHLFACVCCACTAYMYIRICEDMLLAFTQIDVVSESRLYPRWSEMGPEMGIINAKAVVNVLHQRLTEEGYTEV